MAILSLARPKYHGNAQSDGNALAYDGNAQFPKKETSDGNVQSDGNDQFGQKKTSGGKAQFQPMCPKVSRPTVGLDPAGQNLCHLMAMLSFNRRVLYSSKSPDRRVGSSRPKFVSHLMAMLSFSRCVL